MDAVATASSPMPLAFGVVVFLLGVAVVIRHLRRQRSNASIPTDWLAATAKVVDLELQVDSGRPCWKPIYAFDSPAHGRVEATSNHDRPAGNKHALGKQRAVFHDPDDPTDFAPGPSADAWLVLMAGVGLISVGSASVVAWLVGS